MAISDLHVGYDHNRAWVRELRAADPDDWLIVAGDIGERVADIEWALRLLRDRFGTVLWVPGNHELWTHPRDENTLRGVARYEHLVRLCGELGVLTPEDDYPVWPGVGGPVTVAPLFLLYDYTFRPAGTSTKQEALAVARAAGVVCTDEYFLHPDPYPEREDWCAARVAATERRLAGAAATGRPTVLVNHWPLDRHPTSVLYHPEFAQWCGTQASADWHTRFGATAVVYGHLHIPRTTWLDGVRFEEVSLGYPREWQRRPRVPELRRILPGPAPEPGQGATAADRRPT
jgi:3',5'-cyclic AMP phosphodiesterase CpdA